MFYAGRNPSGGYMVTVDHSDGLSTTYLGMSEVSVSQGDSVGAGSKVGVLGDKGDSSSAEAHLHLGAYLTSSRGKERVYRDPASLLPPIPQSESQPDESMQPAPAPAGIPAADNAAASAAGSSAPRTSPQANPQTGPHTAPQSGGGPATVRAGHGRHSSDPVLKPGSLGSALGRLMTQEGRDRASSPAGLGSAVQLVQQARDRAHDLAEISMPNPCTLPSPGLKDRISSEMGLQLKSAWQLGRISVAVWLVMAIAVSVWLATMERRRETPALSRLFARLEGYDGGSSLPHLRRLAIMGRTHSPCSSSTRAV